MLPPDGWRLGAGLYSPASNKTRAPAVRVSAFAPFQAEPTQFEVANPNGASPFPPRLLISRI
jgi:hypothetical protein